MKLLGTPGSPYARKIRIVLEEKRIPHEYVVASPSDPASGVGDYNPLVKVPVLVRDDGRGLYDSPVIVEYLDGLVPEPRLIPAAFEERIEVLRWAALGDGIVDATVEIQHDRRRPEDKRQDEAWYAKHLRKIDNGLAAMERDLGGREFCFGRAFSLADVGAGFAMSYVDRMLPAHDWRKANPNMGRLLERLMRRESFSRTQPPPA